MNSLKPIIIPLQKLVQEKINVLPIKNEEQCNKFEIDDFQLRFKI